MTSAGSTLTVALYSYAKTDGEFDVAVAVVLMVLTIIIDLCAALVGRYFKRRDRI